MSQVNEPITVYPAKMVRTVDIGRPSAEAVAVRGDRIRAVGTVEELMSYPGAVLDERFTDSVIVPGFVEAHAHTFGAAFWNFEYIGYFDRKDPRGKLWTGCDSIDAALERLRQADAGMEDPDTPLLAWGFDAIYFSGERLVASHLDQVSTTRPIFVMHASGHVATVNTALIEKEKIYESTQVEGVMVDDNGYPNGELQEPAAMSLANVFGALFAADGDQLIWDFANEVANVGCTTAADLGQVRLGDAGWRNTVVAATEDDAFPIRLSVFAMAGSMGAGPDKILSLLEELTDVASDKLRFGHIKIVLDGSIQQFTARLQEPGYFDREGNGIWVTAPETYRQHFKAFHEAGCLIHVHCNGDLASEVFLDVLEQVLVESPRWDHRHTMTHSQLTTGAQYRRLAAMGGCANIFSNHIYYWGDQHRDKILGPDRAARMDACNSALTAGVPITLHCDNPITPIDPLATMSYAVNRLTATDKVLGPDERITAEQGLHAITLGGAYTLKMDHEIGSIEAGKLADLAILDADPLTVDPTDIGSIQVQATMCGGVIRDATA